MRNLIQLASLTRACVALAWANLAARRVRSIVATAGICFAIFLLFLQLGFLDAAKRAATQPYDFFEFDLALLAADYQFLYSARTFDRIRLNQIRTAPGVTGTFNLNIKRTRWVDPKTELGSSLMLFGVDDDSTFVRDSALRRGLNLLNNDRHILADDFAHADYGERNVGSTALIREKEVTIAGSYALGPFFYADGSAMVRNNGFTRLSGRSSRDITVGLVRTEPFADPRMVRDLISEILPEDVLVMTKAELIEQEQDYFVTIKPVGLMFHVGVIIAFAVGVVILFQVLSTEIANRLREYATMKAIGFGARFVYAQGIVLTALFTVMSFIPAAVLAAIVFAQVRSISHLPMAMTLSLLSVVLTWTFAIAVASGLITLHRVRRADPAELF